MTQGFHSLGHARIEDVLRGCAEKFMLALAAFINQVIALLFFQKW